MRDKVLKATITSKLKLGNKQKEEVLLKAAIYAFKLPSFALIDPSIPCGKLMTLVNNLSTGYVVIDIVINKF